MIINLNDQKLELPEGATVAQALQAAEISPLGKATAVNGVVVRASERQNHPLKEGDTMLVISAFYGG